MTTAKPLAPIDIANPTRLLNWLTLIKGHALEGIAVGEDLLRPPSKRKLTRAVAREQIERAKRNFLRLYAAAWAAIPPLTPLEIHDPDRDPPSTDPSRDE